MLDFIRIACAVPNVRVGDVKKNAENICGYIEKADAQNVDVIVFPELALTGYTCQDLFRQESLQNAVKEGIRTLSACSAKFPQITCVVGLPLRLGARMYDCAAVFSQGEIAGIVPKTYVGDNGRWFASGTELDGLRLTLGDLGLDTGDDFWDIPIERKLLFTLGDGAVMGVELSDDLWAPMAPSAELAMKGAEIIVNPAAVNEIVGRREFRRNMVKHQSALCSCVYAFCSAGSTESTQDLIYSGHSMIAERGRLLVENAQQIDSGYMIVSDCDLGKIRADRLRAKHFAGVTDLPIREIGCDKLRSDGTFYPVKKLPFVPSSKEEREARCWEIFNMQVAGLQQRLSIIGTNAVIGISGGLDSTLAMLVSVEAMRRLGRPSTDVYCVTMPCFGTSDRTYQNSWELMRTLGVSAKEINIRDAVNLHFRDIGHDSNVHNGTYENAQARERTQILMDYASVVGGIVVGTGDLSELALGWCTYNGDHMSMYGVNASVPKTLIRWIIETVAQKAEFAPAKAVLMDVLDTPISPELLPPDAEGKISQQTEDIVGPYALHDFFLYYVLRFGFAPKKIYELACRGFAGDFDGETVKKWLKNFYRRFFTQQFKRNCVPDGVKVGSVGLGPRGDWQMPSDASANVWLFEAEQL